MCLLFSHLTTSTLWADLTLQATRHKMTYLWLRDVEQQRYIHLLECSYTTASQFICMSFNASNVKVTQTLETDWIKGTSVTIRFRFSFETHFGRAESCYVGQYCLLSQCPHCNRTTVWYTQLQLQHWGEVCPDSYCELQRLPKLNCRLTSLWRVSA